MKKMFLLFYFVAFYTAIFPVYSAVFDVKSVGLEILWTMPIIVDPGPPAVVGKPYISPPEKGLVLDKATMFSDGKIVFLGSLLETNSYSKVLITNVKNHGPEEITKLKLRGVQPKLLEPPTFWNKIFGANLNKPSNIPTVASLAAVDENTIWVGGSTHYYMGIASDSHSDAYLAKLDSAAKPMWERAYKAGRVPFVVSMTPTSTGDLVVAATDGWFAPSWLALIAASDGHLIWEHHLGNGKGIAVVPAHGDRFIVASFDSEGAGAAYQENVSIRTISIDGQLGSATIVRKGINKESSGSYGRLRMSASDNGAYIISSWEVSFLSDPSLLHSSEIAKVTDEGKLLWSKVIPDSFKLNINRGGATFCSDPAIATLPNGDGLVACVLNKQIRLHKFDRHTGNDEQGNLPLPECNDGQHQVSLFLFVRKDGKVFLSGSRPSGNVGQGCSWIGRLIDHVKG